MRRMFFLLIFGMVLLVPQVSWAAEEVEEVEEVRYEEEESSDLTRADDWFTAQVKKPSTTYPYASEGEQKLPPYLKFYEDETLRYYLDTQSIHWLEMPYSASEYLLDVWIKMDPIPGNGDYSYPPKYYMEHYYLRPEKRQIQYLGETEVVGRPSSVIRERKYSYKNWENPVPGSIEDRVYRSVMAVIKQLEKEGTVKKRKSDYDFWDDTLRIGGIF